MESKELALHCRELADSKKAEDIVLLDLKKVSSITDYFLIASGNSDPHVKAIVEEIVEKVDSNHQEAPQAVDGRPPAPWIVIDYIDVIVHVMREDVRHRYDLEGLWGDAPRIDFVQSPT